MASCKYTMTLPAYSREISGEKLLKLVKLPSRRTPSCYTQHSYQVVEILRKNANSIAKYCAGKAGDEHIFI